VSRLLKTTLLALTVAAPLASGMQSGPSEAAIRWGALKDFSFSIENSNLGNPVTFVFTPKNGKYAFERLEGGPIKMRLKGKGYRRSWIDEFGIHLGKNDKGPTIAANDLQKGHWESFDKKVSLNPTRNLLKNYEAKALKYCQDHGKPNKKVIGPLKIPFAGWLHASGKNIISDGSPPPRYIIWVKEYSARVVCMPEAFRVIDADLSVKFDGSPLSCPVKATLTAKFKTNKPGTFKFNLYRGDGEFQTVTRTAGESGVATFTKHYTFKKPTNRKYLVATIPSGASSGWVPMKVNCNNKTDGFQAPKNPHSTNH